MSNHILITGGAGFIGSHLADALLARGHRVRAMDSLTPQVHGPDAARPEYLDPDVELITGDVRDPSAVRRALKGIDVVYHLAAAVGVGQSMYEIALYQRQQSRDRRSPGSADRSAGPAARGCFQHEPLR